MGQVSEKEHDDDDICNRGSWYNVHCLLLGFYTAWLLPAAVVGLLVFLFGVFTMQLNHVAYVSILLSPPTCLCLSVCLSVPLRLCLPRQRRM